MRAFSALSVLYLLLIGCAVQAAEAQSLNPAAAALLNSENQNFDRPKLARLVLNYCTEVLGVLPRNTPREDSWVDEEMKSGNADRMARAVQSIEQARHSLLFSFAACVSNSDKLVKLTSAQRITEAVLWIRLSMAFPSDVADENGQRLGLVRYDEKSGWIDPHGFKSVPLIIVFKSHIAAIESLGHKY